MIRDRLEEVWNFERFTAPKKAAGRYFYRHNSGLQNQYVVMMQDADNADPVLVVDPNSWSEEPSPKSNGAGVGTNEVLLPAGLVAFLSGACGATPPESMV